MIPNEANFCGGNFQDWLEVMLVDKCNGQCSWCIEKDGYKPIYQAHWVKLVNQIIASGKHKVLLLGGEPTLYPDLKSLINAMTGIQVYMTTNGSLLAPTMVTDVLAGLAGVNISIHDYILTGNEAITGLALDKDCLRESIDAFHLNETSVRLNCNLIKGYIDNKNDIKQYIKFAKNIGADSVRFAELKNDPTNFVDLYYLFGVQYGINDDPFILGCNIDCEIDGMPVNFRQMCGLQGAPRLVPENPEQISKTVLYYDGNFYAGWQKENVMTENELVETLHEVQKGNISILQAANAIWEAINPNTPINTTTVLPNNSSKDCRY